MKSKYSHVVTLLSAIAAFAPVLAVDYLLDSYVRVRERAGIQLVVDDLTQKIQAAAYEGITSLRRVLADSPSLCTPTFIANVHQQMQQTLSVRQVLVENTDGVQYCDAYSGGVSYSRLSQDLSMPGRSETIAVVKLSGLPVPALKITQAFGASRRASVFVPVLPFAPESLTASLTSNASLAVALTDGTPVLAAGESGQRSGDLVEAQALVGELPLRVQAEVPFSAVRAKYSDLDAGFTVIACLMSAAFLILALQYVRRSELPALDLERAIDAGEIKPYYQPVINLRTGTLAGCEVLCRWVKRNGDVVSPGVFIDYAEVTGLAIPMTLSLMQQVKADLSELCRDMPDIKISINLFEGHFRDGNVVEDVQAIFGGSQIGYRQLVFEITERQPLAHNAQALSVITGLHALGSRLAMDDAGTGHSKLAYMQTLGLDVIKIDRVFVEMIKPGVQNVPVLDGLITMARELGAEIVAEGVETDMQARYLRARGVVMAQGYLFAPALKASQFIEVAHALNRAPQPRLEALGQMAAQAA